MMKSKTIITIKDIALISLALSIMEVAKYVLGFIPGIEVISLLFIVYTLFFQKKMIYVLPAFCLLEGILYGFGIWWFMYIYIWAILAFAVYLFKDKKSILFWSTLSGAYGLLFGLLCCPVYFIAGGFNVAISWWIAGIPTDIVHGTSNFIICMLLFKPLNRILKIIQTKQFCR